MTLLTDSPNAWLPGSLARQHEKDVGI
jgi:hypothetical protein